MWYIYLSLTTRNYELTNTLTNTLVVNYLNDWRASITSSTYMCACVWVWACLRIYNMSSITASIVLLTSEEPRVYRPIRVYYVVTMQSSWTSVISDIGSVHCTVNKYAVTLYSEHDALGIVNSVHYIVYMPPWTPGSL